MAVKTKKRTKAKKAKKTKKPARKANASHAKKSAAGKTARKAISKSAKRHAKKPAKKAVKKAFGKSSVQETAGKQEQGTSAPASEWATGKVSQPIPETPVEARGWRIRPEVSQSVLKVDTWSKGDLKIEYLKVYRTGWIIVDRRPDLAEYNPDEGLNIFEEFEFDQHELYDGSEEASIVANELPAEERQRMLALSEEELEEEGWTLESVTRFKGPLIVEPV
jgi:hypothetical protein